MASAHSHEDLENHCTVIDYYMGCQCLAKWVRRAGSQMKFKDIKIDLHDGNSKQMLSSTEKDR